MKPIKFKEQNHELKKPENMTDEECSSLPTFTDGVQSISCWKGGFMDRMRFLFTGRMWLGVCSGVTQPPVWVSPKKPFIKEKKK